MITGVFPFSTVGLGSVSQSGLSEVDLERSLLAGSRKIHVLGSASSEDSRIRGLPKTRTVMLTRSRVSGCLVRNCHTQHDRFLFS